MELCGFDLMLSHLRPWNALHRTKHVKMGSTGNRLNPVWPPVSAEVLAASLPLKATSSVALNSEPDATTPHSYQRDDFNRTFLFGLVFARIFLNFSCPLTSSYFSRVLPMNRVSTGVTYQKLYLQKQQGTGSNSAKSKCCWSYPSPSFSSCEMLASQTC